MSILPGTISGRYPDSGMKAAAAQPQKKDPVAVRDRFGELHRQIEANKAKMEPVIDEYNSLKSELEEQVATLDAANGTILEGRFYDVKVSPRENETVVTDKPLVFKLLGGLKSIDLWSITLKHVRDRISTDKHGHVLSTDRTGKRTFKPVAKVSAMDAQKLAA